MVTKKQNNECELCGKSYVHKESLKLHVKTQHSNERPYKCMDCKKDFKDPSVFKRHKELHKLNGERNLECHICKSKFTTKSNLTNHLNRKHLERLYSCPQCGRKVKGRQYLEKHIRKHFESFQCSKCEKVFNCKRNLTKHFGDVHTEKSRLPCTLCDKTFKDRITLRKHLSHIHKNSEQNKWQCDICQKYFANAGSFYTHKKTHTDNSFQCPHCDQLITRKDHLKSHIMRVHEKIKAFQCDLCEKSYFNKVNLTEHRTVHTGEKPFKCNECQTYFRHFASLYKHKRIEHK